MCAFILYYVSGLLDQDIITYIMIFFHHYHGFLLLQSYKLRRPTSSLLLVLCMS